MNDNQIIDGALNYLADFVKNYSAMAGTIKMFAGSVAPDGWLLCNGQAVSRTTYSKLFNVISTTYGEGDGSTTFNVPDLRGRTPVGVGTGTATNATAHTLGQKAGAESSSYTPGGTIGGTALTKAQLPSLTGSIRIRNTSNSSYNMITSASGIAAVEDYGSATGTVSYGTGTNKLQQLTISFGSGSTHTHTWTGTAATINKMQPYLAVNYIICTGDDLDLNPSTNPEFRSGSGTVTVPVAESGSPLTLLATLPAGLWEVKLRCTWPTSAGAVNKNFGINRKGINGAGFFATPSGASTGYTADSISRIIKIDPNLSAEDRNIYLYAWQSGNSEVELDYSYQIVQLGGVVNRDYDYPIGEIRLTSGTISTTSSTTSRQKIDTLPKGVWLLSGKATFSGNTNGERSSALWTGDICQTGYQRKTPNSTGGECVICYHRVVEITDNTVDRDIEISFWQNSGSSLEVSYTYKATQIGGNVDTQYINGAVFEKKVATSEVVNIPASQYTWATIDAPENAVAVTGYYLKGTGNTVTLVYALYFDREDNQARIALRNTASSQACALTIDIEFLCLTNTQPVFVDNTYSDKVDALEATVNNLNQDIFTETYVEASHHSTAYLQGRCNLIKIKGPARTLILGRGWFKSTNNVNIVSSTYLFEIPSGWRPTSDIQGNCMVQYNESGGASGYSVRVGTNGVVTEAFGSTVRGGSFTFHYFIAN